MLYAFDPRRTGVLLIGGDKTGKPNWYQEFVPRADAIYAQHLKEIDTDTDLLTGEMIRSGYPAEELWHTSSKSCR